MMRHTDITGTSYLLRAVPMLFKPELRLYIIAPIIANLLLFFLLLWLGIISFQLFIDWSNAHIPSWLHWLNWLFWTLFSLSFLAFFIFSFTLFACLIAAPFNGLLAEKAEILITKKQPADTSLADFIKDTPRIMAREWQKLLYFIPRAILLLLLFLIPGINLLAPFIWLTFNAWMMAIQYMDYPMDNHKVPFKTMLEYLQGSPIKSLGFGSTVMIAVLIPVLNLIVLPAAVVAATLAWLETDIP
jgi:CysZ protein